MKTAHRLKTRHACPSYTVPCAAGAAMGAAGAAASRAGGALRRLFGWIPPVLKTRGAGMTGRGLARGAGMTKALGGFTGLRAGGARAALLAGLVGLAVGGVAPREVGAQTAERPLDNALSSANATVRGVWVDENSDRVWILDASDGIVAYNRFTGSATAITTYALNSANSMARGLWSDGTHLFVGDNGGSTNSCYAYNLSTGAYTSGSNVGCSTFAVDFWYDGSTYFYEADFQNNTLRRRNKDGTSSTNWCAGSVLSGAGNDHPSGLHSDGTVMWVADFVDNKIYAYSGVGSASCSRLAAADVAAATLSTPITGSPSEYLFGLGGTQHALVYVSDHDSAIYGLNINEATNRVGGRLIAPLLNIVQPDGTALPGGRGTGYGGTVVEGGVGGVFVQVQNSAGTAIAAPQPITMVWKVDRDHGNTSGSITTGGDYDDPGGNELISAGGNTAQTVTIPAGTTGAYIMSVQTHDDTVEERRERLAFEYSNLRNARFNGSWVGGSPTAALTAASASGSGTFLEILDNDTIGISDDTVGVIEGGDVRFTVAIERGLPTQFTVGYRILEESAEDAFAHSMGDWTADSADYSNPFDTELLLTFAPGVTSATIDVSTTDDTIDEEPQEVFAVALLSRPSGELIDISGRPACGDSMQIGCGLIHDNDAYQEFDITSSDAEALETAGPVVFTIRLAEAVQRVVRFSYETEDGSAEAGTDYTAQNGMLTFLPGETELTVAVPIVADEDNQHDTFNLRLHSPVMSVGNIPVERFIGTISEGDTRPEVAFTRQSDAVIDEGGEMVFVATLTNGAYSADLEATAAFMQTGSWLASADPATFTIAAGATELRYTVATVDDNTDEPDGTVEVTFTVGGESHQVRGGLQRVTVNDNDGTPVVFVEDSAGPEGQQARFRVRLQPASGDPTGAVCDCEITVTWQATETTDADVDVEDRATAGTDFMAEVGSLTFAPGVNEQVVTVSLPGEDDNLDESFFDFFLRSPMNAVFPDAMATEWKVRGTIQELPGLGIALAEGQDASVSEAEGPARFTVSMTRVPDDGALVTVPVALEAVTGNLLGAAPPDSVVIAAGELSAEFAVPLDNDARDEIDGGFTARISLPAGQEDGFVFSGNETAAIVVTDDDDAPAVNVIAAERVTEGRVMVFPVRLTGASERTVTVAYTTADGPPPASATAGEDYTAHSGTLIFNPNATELLVEVQTLADKEKDPDERVALEISAPMHATLGTASALGVIREGLNDDEIEALNEAILPHIATAVAEETTGVIQDRVRAAFESGGDGGGSGNRLSIRGAGVEQFLAGLLPGDVGTVVDAAARHSRASGNPEIPGTALDSPELGGKSRGNDGGAGAGAGAAALGENHLAHSINPESAFHGETRAFDFGDWALPAFAATDFNFDAALNADGGAGGGNGHTINLWGRGYYRDLTVDGNPISFEGDITGFMLGTDSRFSSTVLGVAINHAQADFTWDNSAFTGEHETTLTAFHPYFGWQLQSGLRLWGSLGYGEGELELVEDESDTFLYKRDIALRTVALGGYGPLPTMMDGMVDVGIIADAVFAQLREIGAGTDAEVDTTSVATGWVRVGVEAEYDYLLPDGALLAARGELALRGDFGDARDGAGLEFGLGGDYRHPGIGLRFDLKARALVAHEDEVEEWGVSGGIAWAAADTGRGFSLSFSPEWGITATARDRIWNGAFAMPVGNGIGADDRHSSGSSLQAQGNPAAANGWLPGRADTADSGKADPMAGAALRYNLEMKYGIPVSAGSDLLTLFARSDLRDESRNYALGADVKLGEHLSAGYESTLNRRSPFLPAAGQDAALLQSTDHRAYIRFEKRF